MPLYLKRKYDTIAADAAQLAVVLNTHPAEEHESLNYPPDMKYFRYVAMGFEATLYRFDDEPGMDEYDYRLWIHAGVSPHWSASADVALDDALARHLTRRGYDVARVDDHHISNDRYVVYSLSKGDPRRFDVDTSERRFRTPGE